jgi:hypothetical protein
VASQSPGCQQQQHLHQLLLLTVQQQLLLPVTAQQQQYQVVRSKCMPTQQQQRMPHLPQTWILSTTSQLILQACLLRHSSCCSSVALQLVRPATKSTVTGTVALLGCATASRRVQQRQQQQQLAVAMRLQGLMLLVFLRMRASLLKLTQPLPPQCQEQQHYLQHSRQQQRHTVRPAQTQQHAGIGGLAASESRVRPFTLLKPWLPPQRQLPQRQGLRQMLQPCLSGSRQQKRHQRQRQQQAQQHVGAYQHAALTT